MKMIDYDRIRSLKLLFSAMFILNCNVFAQSTGGGIYSSNLGEFAVGVDKGNITGHYLYLGNWDDELKVYMRQNAFSFYGHTRPDTIKGSRFYNITITTELDTSKTPGFVEMSADGKKLTIVAKSMDAIDAAFDVSKYTDYNIFTLTKPIAIKTVGEIKVKQAHLFNYENGRWIARKGYLVAGDNIGLLDTIGSFSKIFYKNTSNGKGAEYYLRTSDISLIEVRDDEKLYRNNRIRLANDSIKVQKTH